MVMSTSIIKAEACTQTFEKGGGVQIYGFLQRGV